MDDLSFITADPVQLNLFEFDKALYILVPNNEITCSTHKTSYISFLIVSKWTIGVKVIVTEYCINEIISIVLPPPALKENELFELLNKPTWVLMPELQKCNIGMIFG